MAHTPQQILTNISQFQRFDFWQFVFLRIYYLSLFLNLTAVNYYSTTEVPTTINTIIWIVASIGFFPFVVLALLILIKSAIIRKYLIEYGIKVMFRNLALVFFMISMLAWIVDDIPIVIEIALLILLVVWSEINFRKNKRALRSLKQAIQ